MTTAIESYCMPYQYLDLLRTCSGRPGSLVLGGRIRSEDRTWSTIGGCSGRSFYCRLRSRRDHFRPEDCGKSQEVVAPPYRGPDGEEFSEEDTEKRRRPSGSGGVWSSDRHIGWRGLGQQGFGDQLLRDHLFTLIPSTVSRHSWNVIFDGTRLRMH